MFVKPSANIMNKHLEHFCCIDIKVQSGCQIKYHSMLPIMVTPNSQCNYLRKYKSKLTTFAKKLICSCLHCCNIRKKDDCFNLGLFY